MDRFYTGVGARRTPQSILDVMARLADKLEKSGFTLRSGGAAGADRAFERGCTVKTIFYARDCTTQAMAIAAKYHPAWERCSEFARKLHGRNAFQVLGRNLDTPSEFLVCWTPDGCLSHKTRTIRTGGTGTAISIASDRGVPVFNLARPEHLNRIRKYLAG